MKFAHLMLGVAALTAVAGAASAQTATDAWDQTWMVRGRMIQVDPANDGGNVSIGGKAKASASPATPEVDVTYFLNQNIGFELIAATTKHGLHVDNRPAELDLGDTWLLPPTLTAQYHIPCGKWKPYVGAGITYAHFYNSEHPGWGSVKVDDAWGVAAQAGVDYAISGPWVLNADIKKIWLSTDLTVNGTVTAKANLNPTVLGAGVGYRF